MLIEQPAGHVTTPIMPARPLCYGGPCGRMPSCSKCAWVMADCFVDGTYLRHHNPRPRLTDAIRHLWWTISDQEYDLTMARSFVAELRERVEALEWYVECIRNISRAHHRWAGVNPLADDDRLHDAYIEAGATLAHARKESGV